MRTHNFQGLYKLLLYATLKNLLSLFGPGFTTRMENIKRVSYDGPPPLAIEGGARSHFQRIAVANLQLLASLRQRGAASAYGVYNLTWFIPISISQLQTCPSNAGAEILMEMLQLSVRSIKLQWCSQSSSIIGSKSAS